MYFCQATKRKSELEQISRSIEEEMKQFEDKHDGAVSYKKRKFDTHQAVSLIDPSKKKLMDDTDHAEKLDQLKAVCPWIPLFTPNAEPTLLKEPPKRPQSPYSQRPLRSKDLVPINLIRESTDEQSSTGSFKYVCPVSRCVSIANITLDS